MSGMVRPSRPLFFGLFKFVVSGCVGNSTYSAITAIIAANIVLVAYIVLSLLEDKQEREGGKVIEKAESRKER